jgi:hypothetical protein
MLLLALDVAVLIECRELSISGLVAVGKSRAGEFERVNVAVSLAAVGI